MINCMRCIIFCIISGLFLTSTESRVEFDIYHDGTHHSDGLESIQTPNQTYDIVGLSNFMGTEYYGLIQVGKPAKEFKVRFNTAWAHSWLPSQECALYEVACLLHTRYDNRKSSTYQKNGTSFSVSTDTMSLSGHMSVDDFHLPHLKVKNQTFIEMTHLSMKPFALRKADGTIGLAFSTLSPDYLPFFYNMYRQKIINDTIFTFYSSRDTTTNKAGRLILGGTDRSRNKTDLTYLPVREKKYWTILIDKIIIGINNATSTFCNDSCYAMIDTGSNDISGPADAIHEINMAIGARQILSQTYMVNCNEIPKIPHITFVLNDKNFTIKAKDYIQRTTYLGFTICTSPFTPTDTKTVKQWQLGNTFLMQFYTEFDISKGRIAIAEPNE